MAIEPVYEKPTIDCLRRLGCAQAVVEARITPSNGVSIAKVLSVAQDVTVTPSEVFSGEARYSGRVNFKALIVDTGGVCSSMEYAADFSDKIMSDELVAGLKPILSARILDTDIISVSEGELKLAAVVEVCLKAVVGEGVKCLISGGENIYTHDDRIDYCKLVGSSAENFAVSGTLGDVMASELLLSEPKVIVTRRAANLDSVVLEGSIINDLCMQGDSGIVSYQMVTPFSQEVSVPQAHADNIICDSVSVISSDVRVESADGKNVVCADYKVGVNARAFSSDAINVIVDAFSVTNELLSSGESVKICINKQSETITDRVEGNVTLDGNLPLADNILAVTSARLTVSDVKVADGVITFEGIVSCNIIYYAQETNSKNTIAVELPFSIAIKADVRTGDIVEGDGIVTAVSAKVRRGNEIDIKADIAIATSSYSEDVKYFITDLKLGEERAMPSGAFAIHIARGGETLWDIAKALSSTPEQILLQNPALVLPLTGGERVIAYRHLK